MYILNKNLNRTVILLISVLVPLVVAVLLFLPNKTADEAGWIKLLPHAIAIINSTTVLLLLAAFYFIKKGQIENHKNSMFAALILGIVFLACYITYHSSAPGTSYGGEGVLKYIYYFFLLTHILLSIVVVPFVLFAFYFALNGNIIRHKKLVKYTFPVWLYVSVTGVIVYLMIRPYYV